MKEPKFKVGDEVNTPKNLYDETSGEVTQVEKIFQEVGDDGKFDMDGLATLEDTIQSIKLPYKFDGETLNIRIPASTIKLRHGEMRENARTRTTSKFYGYAYTVTTDKMNSVFSEISLRLKKKVDEGKWKDKALTWFHTLPVIKQTDVMADAKADPGDEKFYEHLRKRYG